MLRLDPGDGRVHTTRTFQAWEGGGEYNVARGLRRCFGLRTADRHRARRQPGRPPGRRPDAAGRRRSVASRWVKYDGVGRDGAQRPQLHRARLRRARGARLLRSRPHGGVAAEAGRRRLGRDLRPRTARAGSTPAASSARSRETTPLVARGGDGSGAPARHASSRTTSTTATRSGRSIGGQAKRARGQPRARAARRRDDRQRGGLHAPRSASRSRASTSTSRALDPANFRQMIEHGRRRRSRTSRSSRPRCARAHGDRQRLGRDLLGRAASSTRRRPRAASRSWTASAAATRSPRA